MKWEDLAVPYFEEDVISVLEPYFELAGFVTLRDSKTPATNINFDNGTSAVAFEYWPEDSPNYVLQVGVRPSRRGGPFFHEFGLWFVLPAEHPFMTRKFSGFRTSAELRVVLENVRGVVETHLKPIWSDQKRLVAIGDKANKERGG